MLLNYEYQNQPDSVRHPIVFIHGLFGSLSNLGMLARAFMPDHSVVQIDVRNHGKSVHTAEMQYEQMAQDILDTMDHLEIQHFYAVGHSMGGKIAMQAAGAAPDRIEKLAVLDIAPYAYQKNHHDQIFQALIAVENAQIESRSDAVAIMKQYIAEDMVIQFLLKSFSKGQWLFNVQALYHSYPDILGWTEQPAYSKPALFLRGGNSPYVHEDAHFDAIAHQFPAAQIIEIENAGHWLHAEKTAAVLERLQDFFNS